jgi:hypothetical protein
MPNAKKNYSSRQGDGSGHRRSASITQAVDLSVRQEVQGFGIWFLSVTPGDKTANVCARTFTSPSVVAIFGMWQATHWLPVRALFVICMFLERGPAGTIGREKEFSHVSSSMPQLATRLFNATTRPIACTEYFRDRATPARGNILRRIVLSPSIASRGIMSPPRRTWERLCEQR